MSNAQHIYTNRSFISMTLGTNIAIGIGLLALLAPMALVQGFIGLVVLILLVAVAFAIAYGVKRTIEFWFGKDMYNLEDDGFEDGANVAVEYDDIQGEPSR